MPVALRPVRGFPTLPEWTSLPTDYYGHCVPSVLDTAPASRLRRGETDGSPVAIWLLEWGRVGFRTRSPLLGA